jgi:hypothetical protein
MSLPQAVFLLSFAAAIIGVLLIWRGRRGRRVGRHLHCRNCEHDLFGVPSSTRRCPECGELIRYGRPRGRYEPNKRLIHIGLCLLPPAMLALSIIVVTEGRKIRWIEHEPLWYVLECIRPSAVSPRGEAHLEELDRRLTSGKLSTADTNRVIVMLLKYQSDPDRPWSVHMGRMIERFQRNKQLTAIQWQQYLMDGVGVALKYRPVVGTREPFAGALYVRGDRYGDAQPLASVTLDHVQVDDQRLSASGAATGPLYARPPICLKFAADADLPDGAHELVVGYTLTITDLGPQNSLTFSSSRQLKQKLEVHPGAQTIEPFHLHRQPQIIRNWSGSNGDYAPHVPHLLVDRSSLAVSFFPLRDMKYRRYAMAYDVLVRSGDSERLLGQTCWPMAPDRGDLTFPLHTHPPARSVDVVLRPSRDRALRDVDVETWCATEVVFKDVTLDH